MPKKTKSKKEVVVRTDNDRILDIIKSVKELTDLVSNLQENLFITNKNCQYACDKIEQIELKLNQVAGRLGLQ